MSTQVLQLNQSKGRVTEKANRATHTPDQGADCASAPAGTDVTYIARPQADRLTAFSPWNTGRTTRSVYVALQNLKDRGLGEAIVPFMDKDDLHSAQMAGYRRAKKLDMLILTRVDYGQKKLHIFNRAIVG
jgi:hypothetical protein